VKLLYILKTHYRQSEIFQAFVCYNFDDYGLQKTPNSKLEYCEKVFIAVSKIMTNKGLKYLTLQVTGLYNTLVSHFKLNY